MALACGQAADGDRYLKRYQEMVNSIYKYHHYSCKHSANLKEIQSILDCAERKFKQVFHTRWLSFDGAVQAILANLNALITELIADGESEPAAKGILRFITTFSFMAVTHFLSDVLPILSRLSKGFQRQQVDFTVITEGVNSTVAALESFKTNPGPKLKKFLNEIPEDTHDSFYFMDQQISYSQHQRNEFNHSTSTFIDKLISNLQSRFPDSNLLGSLSVFDPQKLPVEPSELATYGAAEIDVLCAHYGTPKTGKSGQELAPLVCVSETEDEWVQFKQLMSSNYRSCTIQSMAEKLLKSVSIKEDYPNIVTLITLALSLPVSTADCERGFSKYNLIKTKLRA